MSSSDERTASVKPRYRRSPGSLVVHPLPVAAIALLVLNDRVLKERWPGLVTGKLSDLAALFVLPVLAVSVVELLAHAGRRPYRASASVVLGVCLLTAVGFTLTKTVPAVSWCYGVAIGLARWPIVGGFHRVLVATDPTDLIALTSVVGAAWYAGLLRAIRPAKATAFPRL